MIISYRNLLRGDKEKILQGKKARDEQNTGSITKLNNDITGLFFKSLECDDNQVIGYQVEIEYKESSDIYVYFKDKEPAKAFEKFMIELLCTNVDYIEIDVLTHGAV